MRAYVEISNDSMNIGFEKLFSLRNGKAVQADLRDASFDLELQNGKRLILYGDIFYHVKNDGNIKLIDSDSERYLKKIFSENKLKDITPCLEGQYIGLYVDASKKLLQIFSDRYARLDTFYALNGSDFYFGTDLDFVFKKIKPEYDQKMLAHLFTVYGWYTPNGLTIYKNVKQLKIGEILTISDSGMQSDTIKFKPLEIEDYTDKDLETYYKILRDSVVSRANRNGKTWVSSSSGWDSSLILGLLVNEFGSHNIGMITGSMEYSEGTDVINKFEINKIKKIGEFYDIKPNIVDLDFKSKKAPAYWQKVLPYYKSKHMYTYVTYNFAKLSAGLKDAGGDGQIVCNGETSDSFHNFGFSQFATFFHTKKSFTEYADKMNCYLYGPSFLNKVLNGSYEKDKVFQIFKRMSGTTEFTTGFKNKDEILESYLFPFFYGSPRIPFAATFKNPVLNAEGQKSLYRFPYREYMPEVLKGISADNIYSWFIYMYHGFHSQGSTVNIQKHAMESNNHRWRSPYNDYRLIEFLSKAPEKWGRGLEMNNTKYPLKWVAKNRIKFPYELLNEGPHSYLYDVIEGFSLFAEITYRSGVTAFFKETLKGRPYKNILIDEYFDMKYLDRLCAEYLEGREAKGQDFNNLVSLITLCVTGWY